MRDVGQCIKIRIIKPHISYLTSVEFCDIGRTEEKLELKKIKLRGNEYIKNENKLSRGLEVRGRN